MTWSGYGVLYEHIRVIVAAAAAFGGISSYVDAAAAIISVIVAAAASNVIAATDDDDDNDDNLFWLYYWRVLYRVMTNRVHLILLGITIMCYHGKYKDTVMIKPAAPLQTLELCESREDNSKAAVFEEKMY